MAFPIFDEKHTFTQPDGTTVEVTVRGDQYHALFRSAEGYAMVVDPHSGFLCYADKAPDGSLASTGIHAGAKHFDATNIATGLRADPSVARRTAARQRASLATKRRCDERREQARDALKRGAGPLGILSAPPRRGTVGDYKGLTLLVAFPDVTSAIKRSAVDDFCNKPGYNGSGNKGSVYDYFADNSRGLFKYTNLVTDYYVAKHPRAYYTDPKISYGQRAQELIREALAWLRQQPGVNLSDLTTDNQGYVYAVNVLYAGARSNNWGEGLWPHSSALGQPFALAPGQRAYDYQITDLGSDLSLATFCHENGHMVCDFPDLYDYGFQSEGVGQYCLMCAGGSDRKNPTRICGYLRLKAGWAGTVVDASQAGTLSLPADGNLMLIHRKSATEYFLVENRYRQDRDKSLPCSGLAVWHVDELGSNDNEQRTPTKHYECSLEQADGRFDLERNTNIGDDGDLFGSNGAFSDTSQPAATWWDGTPSGLRLDSIGKPGVTTSVRASVWGNSVATAQLRRVSSPELPIPDDNVTGVADAITINDAGTATVGSLSVAVSIKHTYAADLRVALVSPSGAEILLHDRAGGASADIERTFTAVEAPGLGALAGEPINGRWTLRVQDLAPSDIGVFKKWELAVTPRDATALVSFGEPAGVPIPDADPKGVVRQVTTAESGVITTLQVTVDISHTYVGDLTVALIAPTGDRVVLHDRKGASTDNLLATYTPDTTAGLGKLIGKAIAGTWSLEVADHEGQDVGKLNRWGVEVGR